MKYRNVLYCFYIALFSLLFRISFVTCDIFERRLIEFLFTNYDPLARPVINVTQPVEVSLGVILQQIVDVDEKNQIIYTNIWLRYMWEDNHMKWNPAVFGGIKDLRFPVDKIWKPDILLYNSVDQKFDSTYPTNVVVHSTGEISWMPPGIVKSSCKLDITWFPFDDQICELKFGSWTYGAFRLNLQPDSKGLDVSEYVENGEWKLITDVNVTREEKFYECCPEPYPSLKFLLHIRRRTLYYGFNLIIPGLMISLMTMLGFTLPPESGEKLTLEITILISICFLLTMVADMVPPTSEAVPLIGIFFFCCNIAVSASVIFTVVVLNLHHRNAHTHSMGPVTKKILLNWLPWILLMKRPGYQFSRTALTIAYRKKHKQHYSESLIRNILAAETPTGRNPHFEEDHRRKSIDVNARSRKCLHNILSQQTDMVEPALKAVLLVLQKTYNELVTLTKKMEENDTEVDTENDWRFAARVIDRMCLFVFSSFILVSTLGIMLNAPHLIA